MSAIDDAKARAAAREAAETAPVAPAQKRRELMLPRLGRAATVPTFRDQPDAVGVGAPRRLPGWALPVIGGVMLFVAALLLLPRPGPMAPAPDAAQTVTALPGDPGLPTAPTAAAPAQEPTAAPAASGGIEAINCAAPANDNERAVCAAPAAPAPAAAPAAPRPATQAAPVAPAAAPPVAAPSDLVPIPAEPRHGSMSKPDPRSERGGSTGRP